MNDHLVLEKLLIENDLSQQQLADMLGVKKQAISQIFTGKRNASKNIKAQICELFPSVVFAKEDTETNTWFLEQRKSKNLTQQEFANILGISQSLCAKFETGERKITPGILKQIRNLNNKTPEVAYINYCPNLFIPNYSLFTSCDKFAIDKRVLVLDNLEINPSDCYAIRVNTNDLYPVFSAGDMVIIITSIKTFLNDNIFCFNYKGQNYVRKIILLPDKVKCISLNYEEDTFYLTSTKGLSVIGMILPKVRL